MNEPHVLLLFSFPGRNTAKSNDVGKSKWLSTVVLSTIQKKNGMEGLFI